MNPPSIVSSITTVFSIPSLSFFLLTTSALFTPAWGQVKTVEIVRNPRVEQEKVTLRVKVTDEADKPMVELQQNDFKIQVTDKENNKTQDNIEFKWTSPELATPPPAWIIILLDMSGSMTREDSRGTTKIQGAITAIKQFIELAKERGGNTQISIVPFGDPGNNCLGYPVNINTLDKFAYVDDAKLEIFLQNLGAEVPCASTNLYEPLTKAVKFLSRTNDTRFYPVDSSGEPVEIQPRLSIILLSDGYHNKPNEIDDFKALTQLLENNKQIIVHTLGYGLTPQQLGQKYKLNRSATRDDVRAKKVPEDEFVDEKRLQQIAKMTGGISEFSGDAEAIAQKLQIFLNALLGEYEISYLQPNPERGKAYQVKTLVKDVASEPKDYRITVFGRALPLRERLIMILVIIMVLGIGGVIPFYIWGQKLKKQTT